MRLRHPATLCDNCYRLARGFWFQLHDNVSPLYAACSLHCLDAIEASAKEHNGVAQLTQMEKQAIAAARLPLWQKLSEYGLEREATALGPEKFDAIILAVWDGLRTSMQTQSQLDDEIPF